MGKSIEKLRGTDRKKLIRRVRRLGFFARIRYGFSHKDTGEKICMIAHRGHSGYVQENTEQAFLAAAKAGFGGAETDVRVTADGVLVLSHNETARFADGSEMPIASSYYKDLIAKPLFNQYNDDTVYLCTFRRYLEIMRDNRMICFIEFKSLFPERKIQEAFTTVEEVYELTMCQLQSRNFENLLRAHEAFPDLKIMLTWGEADFDYHECFEYGFDIDCDCRYVTKKLIRDFHDRGLKVGLWTANDLNTLSYCRSLGADYVETDYFNP